MKTYSHGLMNYRTKLIALFALLATLTGLGGCGHHELPLRVGHNPWPGYLGLYYARELKLFDDNDVQLVQLESAEDVLSAFRNGAIDAAALTLDEALLLADNDQDPRIVMVFDTSNGADVVLARPEIKSPADLRTHRIGVETNALGAYMLARLLQQAKLNPSDVTIVNLPLSRHESAWREGLVDAVITFDPPRARLLASGARTIFSSADIPGEIVDVLVIRASTLHEHQHHLATLISSYFTAMAQLQDNRELAAHALAAQIDLTPDELFQAWQQINFTNHAANRALLAPQGSLAAVIPTLEQVMLEQQLLEHSVNTRPLLDDRLVRGTTE